MRRVVITRNGWLSHLAANNPRKHQQMLKMLFAPDSLANERQFDVVQEGQRWS